jgi:hypothetical protein
VAESFGLSATKVVQVSARNVAFLKNNFDSINKLVIGLFTLKLDLWTAFGNTGFSVYGLFDIGAFKGIRAFR